MPQRIPDGYLSEHPSLLIPVDEIRRRIEERIDKAPQIAIEEEKANRIIKESSRSTVAGLFTMRNFLGAAFRLIG